MHGVETVGDDVLKNQIRALLDVLRRGVDLIYREIIARVLSRVLPARIMSMGKYFALWEKRGYHVLPVHYYSPVPATSELTPEVLQHKSAMVGIDMRENTQLVLLKDFGTKYGQVFNNFPAEATIIPFQYYVNNAYFPPVDASVLYSMVRYYRPKTILEIGSGFSTFVSAQAVRDNRKEGIDSHLIAIEPHPRATLQAGFDGLDQLIVESVQRVPLARFEELEENDILFIDSTHVMKAGSDVQKLYLEIIPRLRCGVIVHVHDIFLPYEYPKEWLLDHHRFWNEQYILQSFLSGRQDFEVLCAVHFILRDYPDLAHSIWKDNVEPYNKKTNGKKSDFRPSASFWFRRKLDMPVVL